MYSAAQLDKRYGESKPRDRLVDSVPAGNVDYWADVKPVLEQRCVVCHSCYDAPCQLKLSSIEGIERGASPALVYDQSRLTKSQPTRLLEDAHTVAGWRKLGFHAVLNERDDTPEANREASVMYRIMALKEENPLPAGKVLPASFDLQLDRKQFCAKPDNFDEYATKNPLWGMPYALPGLDARRQFTLLQWLEQGAEYTARPPLPVEYRDEIRAWEAFLNGDSLKAQLSARYIYEHLFLMHLYFRDLDERRYFKLVRSATPPGEPLVMIATRRPYNDPNVERVYYRLVEDVGTVIAKTHMPYALDATRINTWRQIFIEADYTVTRLPSYDEEVASNPFRTFDEIPVKSRYLFMLDEAQNTIMSFIKGPVCRGQVALNVINDRFWVFFLNPDDEQLEVVEDFLVSQTDNMDMPASTENIYNPFRHWRRYSKRQKALIAARDEYLSTHTTFYRNISLDLIWDGDGTNDNAALTVFRHFDSATVEKGLVGRPPKTAWVIGYTLLERIHYLLVAGYDVYGNVGHQLLTRVYMDFLRMEGETTFLMLLPQDARDRERQYWYRDADKEISDYMMLPRFESDAALEIDYRTDDPKTELYFKLKSRLAPVLSSTHDLSAIAEREIATQLNKLQELVGRSVTLMPQVVFVRLAGKSGDRYVTLVRNNAHTNMTALFGEKKFRIPEEDTLTVVPGFLGAHPNALYVVQAYDIERFVDMVSSLRTEGDYARLLDNYGIRRTSPEFWSQSDAFMAAYQKDAPIEYGLFDYNRLENR